VRQADRYRSTTESARPTTFCCGEQGGGRLLHASRSDRVASSPECAAASPSCRRPIASARPYDHSAATVDRPTGLARSEKLSFVFKDLTVARWPSGWRAGLGRRRARVQIAVATLSGNSLRQTVHTHSASAHQAAKLVAALLRVAGVTAGLAESIGSLPPGL